MHNRADTYNTAVVIDDHGTIQREELLAHSTVKGLEGL